VTALAILAAGASTRLGRRKQLVELDGEPLVRRAARLACASSCARVAVVLGAFIDDIRPALDGLPVDILGNADWREGMASSIRVAVRWATGASGLVLALCDQPALTTAHLDALIAAGGLVGSAYASTVGVPAHFPADTFAQLALLTGDRGARDLLATARSIPFPDGDRDVDTEADAQPGSPARR